MLLTLGSKIGPVASPFVEDMIPAIIFLDVEYLVYRSFAGCT